MRYLLYDFAISSNVPLPELPAAPDAAWPAPAIVVERTLDPIADAPAVWFHAWLRAGEQPWLSAARSNGGYLLRFDGLADFCVSASGDRIRGFAANSTTDETFRHLLLDQVLPLVVSHRGEIVLHGSAVLVRERAVVLLARAGSGKSTLAGALAARGARVLGDDAIAVRAAGGRSAAVGAYPGLRLWPDVLPAVATGARGTVEVAQYTEKRRFRAGDLPFAFACEPAQVAAVYVLDPGAGPAVFQTLAGREAVMAFLMHAYVLDVEDRRRLRAQLDLIVEHARLVPVRRLSFCHDFDRLGEVCDLVLADADRSTMNAVR